MTAALTGIAESAWTAIRYPHLHRALEQAVECELLARNPATEVKRPRAGEPHERFLLPAEAAQLLAAARGTRLYALVGVALAIGLRRGEALALRWSDVDLDVGSVTVRRTLSRVGSALTFSTPKNGKSRTVPLPAPSVRILQGHRQALIAERLALAPAWTDLDLVFPSRLGTVAEPRSVLREFTSVVARAGLPAARFHTLRHSCGALLVAQGVHLQVIAEILGHSDIRVTSAVHAHVGERSSGTPQGAWRAPSTGSARANCGQGCGQTQQRRCPVAGDTAPDLRVLVGLTGFEPATP